MVTVNNFSPHPRSFPLEHDSVSGTKELNRNLIKHSVSKKSLYGNQFVPSRSTGSEIIRNLLAKQPNNGNNMLGSNQ